MIELEAGFWKISDDDLRAEEMMRSLTRRAHTGDIHLGFPRYVEEVLTERWHKEGYEKLLTFVDKECNPIVISRLSHAEAYDRGSDVSQDEDVSYRFFVDGDTKDVVIPAQFVGEPERRLCDDMNFLLFEINEEPDALAQFLEGSEKVAEDILWLYEKFGRKLTISAGTERIPSHIVAQREVLGVRLTSFQP